MLMNFRIIKLFLKKSYVIFFFHYIWFLRCTCIIVRNLPAKSHNHPTIIKKINQDLGKKMCNVTISLPLSLLWLLHSETGTDVLLQQHLLSASSDITTGWNETNKPHDFHQTQNGCMQNIYKTQSKANKGKKCVIFLWHKEVDWVCCFLFVKHT